MNGFLKQGVLTMCLFALLGATASSYAATFRLWSVDQTGNDEVMSYETRTISNAQHTPQGVLDLAYKNMRKTTRPRILLIKNEVAYVNLEGDAEYITNRSGTTGAWYFGATVVFNLTEFKDIKYVYFVDEGDHFGAGRFERLDYWTLMRPEEKLKYKTEIEKRLNAKHENVVRYVEYLREIGDPTSVRELNDVRRQLARDDYGGCAMPREEFEKYLKDTIAVIEQRAMGQKKQ